MWIMGLLNTKIRGMITEMIMSTNFELFSYLNGYKS